MTAAARLIDITKDYVLKSETVRALRGVSFDVPEGDYVAIMGPSGSGKSTLLNLLGCLDRPTAGQFFLGDDDVAQMNDDQLAVHPRHAHRLRLSVVQPDPAATRCSRTSKCRCYYQGALIAPRAASAAANWPTWSAWASGSGTARRSSPAVSSSASPSPAAWSTIRTSSWPTKRRATSTRVTTEEILAHVRAAERRRQDDHHGHARRRRRRPRQAHHPPARRPRCKATSSTTTASAPRQTSRRRAAVAMRPQAAPWPNRHAQFRRQSPNLLALELELGNHVFAPHLPTRHQEPAAASDAVAADGAGHLHRRGERDLAAGDRRRHQPGSPAADRRPRRRQHHRPLASSRPPKSRQLRRADSLRPEARRIRHAGADDPHDQIGPADSRNPPHVHLRRPQCDGRLVGCTPEYVEVTRLELERGRFLTEADVDGRHNYLRAGQRHRRAPLPLSKTRSAAAFSSPRTRTTTKSSASSKYRTPTAAIGGSLEAQDFNSDVYIPISTLRQRIGDFVYTRRGSSRTSEIVELNQITLRVDSVENVRATADLVRKTLRVPEESKSEDSAHARLGKAAKPIDGTNANRRRGWMSP